MLTGRVVDSYTNILTVKLFSRARDEDAFVREAVDHAHRRLPRPDADDHRLCRGAVGDERDADRRHREPRDLAMERRAHLARLGGDGAAADLADHQHGRLGGAQRHLDLREHRHGAGRHAVRSPSSGRCRTRRARANCGVTRGEIRFEDLHFDYGRQRASGARRRAARHRPAHRAGRAGRAGRAVRRRQVDAGEPAAAFLRHRARPHPDRRAGHRHRDAGEPAHADRHGDAGHLAAAPLDPRQHPLRPAAGDAGDDRGCRAARRGARVHPRAGGLARQARLRRACRRARREAVRRPAAARGAGARDPEGRADPGAGRGDLGAGFGGRGGDPGASSTG